MKAPRYLILAAILMGVFLTTKPLEAYANPPLIMRGVVKTLASVVQIPASIIQDSTQVMFPVGIVTGTVKGSVRTVTGILGGAFDIVRGALPYAKYAAAFL